MNDPWSCRHASSHPDPVTPYLPGSDTADRPSAGDGALNPRDGRSAALHGCCMDCLLPPEHQRGIRPVAQVQELGAPSGQGVAGTRSALERKPKPIQRTGRGEGVMPACRRPPETTLTPLITDSRWQAVGTPPGTIGHAGGGRQHCAAKLGCPRQTDFERTGNRSVGCRCGPEAGIKSTAKPLLGWLSPNPPIARGSSSRPDLGPKPIKLKQSPGWQPATESGPAGSRTSAWCTGVPCARA